MKAALPRRNKSFLDARRGFDEEPDSQVVGDAYAYDVLLLAFQQRYHSLGHVVGHRYEVSIFRESLLRPAHWRVGYVIREDHEGDVL